MAKIDYDQLDDFNLDGIVDKDILQYNSATQDMEPAKLPVYGTRYQFGKVITPTSTSSTSYQTHQTLVTPSLPAGTYLIDWGFTYLLEFNANPYLQVSVQANGVNLEQNNFYASNETSSSTDGRYKSHSMQQFVLATPGVITITIRLRRQGSNKLVTLYDSRISLIRVL